MTVVRSSYVMSRCRSSRSSRSLTVLICSTEYRKTGMEMMLVSSYFCVQSLPYVLNLEMESQMIGFTNCSNKVDRDST